MKVYNEHIVRLMEAYLTGKLDEEGRKELDAWCEASEKNRKFFARICREDRIAREVPIYAEVDEVRAFRRFQKRVRGRKRFLRRVARCAAILLLPLAAVAVWQWMGAEREAVVVQEIVPGSFKAVLTLAGGEEVRLQEGNAVEERLVAMDVEQKEGVLSYQAVKPSREKAEEVEYNMLATGRGGEYQLVLSDGTQVFLNAATTLKYPVAFGNGERRVELDGEAYFEVATDSSRAFVVKVGDMEVEVYGTSFDVTTFYEGEVRTVLVEGSVGVRESGSGEECRIAPGEMAVYDQGDGSIVVKETDVALYTSWKEGLFKFEEERLEDIMGTLSRWYDVEVFFYNDALRNMLFTGDLRRYDNIGEHLRMLQMTTNVAFEVRGNAVFVGYRK